MKGIECLTKTTIAHSNMCDPACHPDFGQDCKPEGYCPPDDGAMCSPEIWG